MYKELSDIPKFKSFKVIEKINAGWSNDLKFYIKDYEDNKLLLRISDISQYNDKLEEFGFIKKCNTLDFEMSQAIEIGTCNNNSNIYMLLTWVEGQPLGDELSRFSENDRYKLGFEAGKILKEIHSLKKNQTDKVIATDNKGKILRKINEYENSINRVKEDEFAIDFVRNNIKKIDSLPPVYKHGDYHVGNLILTPSNNIGVIDFNRWDYGDRYEEFQRIQSFDIEASISFSVGKIHGYFDKNPPTEFWDTNAIYVAYNSLGSIVWAEKFGQKDVEGMKRRCIDAFYDYDNFKEVIPNWYRLNSDKYI